MAINEALAEYLALYHKGEVNAVTSRELECCFQMRGSELRREINRVQKELDAYAQAKGYADADAMLADSDAYFEHLAKQDLVFQAIAEQLDITPTQEQIDSANSSYADTYGAQRSMLNALQLAVLDKVEESAVLS